MSRLLLFFGLLGTALGPSASAQPTPPLPPTPPAPPVLVFAPADLDALFTRPPRVEVNLRGALLRLAAQATADDPQAAAMMRGLRGVTVRVYPLDAAVPDFARHLSGLGDTFARMGWDPLVRVRSDEDGEDTWVYVRAGERLFEGLAVAAVDAGERTVSFVLIDGEIDPAQVGALGSRFGNVTLPEGTTEGTIRIRLGTPDGPEAQRAAEEARKAAQQAREAARAAREAARDERERVRAERDARRSAPAGRP